MNQKFQVIVLDPPFSFGDVIDMISTPRGAAANYSTMSISDLKQLPVKLIADPEGAILCLWVPGSMLQDGLDLMKTYGFTCKQNFVWVKTRKNDNVKKLFYKAAKGVYEDLKNQVPKLEVFNKFKVNLGNVLGFGMGRLFRQTHEICLIGTNSNKIYQRLQNKSQRSVCFADNLKHSAKPEALQDSLDLMFPNANTNKIELFSRRQRKGWICIGNEAPGSVGEDIRDSLDKLINGDQ